MFFKCIFRMDRVNEKHGARGIRHKRKIQYENIIPRNDLNAFVAFVIIDFKMIINYTIRFYVILVSNFGFKLYSIGVLIISPFAVIIISHIWIMATYSLFLRLSSTIKIICCRTTRAQEWKSLTKKPLRYTTTRHCSFFYIFFSLLIFLGLTEWVRILLNDLMCSHLVRSLMKIVSKSSVLNSFFCFAYRCSQSSNQFKMFVYYTFDVSVPFESVVFNDCFNNHSTQSITNKMLVFICWYCSLCDQLGAPILVNCENDFLFIYPNENVSCSVFYVRRWTIFYPLGFLVSETTK